MVIERLRYDFKDPRERYQLTEIVARSKEDPESLEEFAISSRVVGIGTS